MKIPSSFRIDVSKDKSCLVGGFRHRERKMTDDFGRHNGYQCLDCGHKTYIKRRNKTVKQKITL